MKRRIDALVAWKANFLRLDLESYGSAGGRTHYKPITQDLAYLKEIQAIVAHITTKPGVYVLVSFWIDPTFSSLGWPTAQTNVAWRLMAKTFAQEPRVMFGLCNEPQQNYNGALDAQVWKAMNDAVQAIRDEEQQAGTPQHIIAVQGTGGWGRLLSYYVAHPIQAGGGKNIVYETHAYNPTADFQQLFVVPAATLPVIIGEFGPAQSMSQQDALNLMSTAEQHDIPYLAWTFHMRCSPDLLVDSSGGGCGVGMPLQPTSWGQQLKQRLAQPW